MRNYIPPVARLIEQFEKLPGIGHKTAQRLAFYILSSPKEQAYDFALALTEAKEKVALCRVCQNLCENELCPICASSSRDRSIICVVEQPKDLLAMESTREFKGVYHVLHGVISPVDNIGPNDIKIKELISRLSDQAVSEIIIATNPDIEGEATAMYLARLIHPLGIKVSRIAFGLPVGGDLEYADEITLLRALEGRREI